jgi:hypothetical protein
MGDTFDNVTIIFKNGEKKFCDVVTIIDKGVYIGELKSIVEDKLNIINHGYIPKDQIHKIIISNEGGKVKTIEF